MRSSNAFYSADLLLLPLVLLRRSLVHNHNLRSQPRHSRAVLRQQTPPAALSSHESYFTRSRSLSLGGIEHPPYQHRQIKLVQANQPLLLPYLASKSS